MDMADTDMTGHRGAKTGADILLDRRMNLRMQRDSEVLGGGTSYVENLI
jgi:hypothetical protein